MKRYLSFIFITLVAAAGFKTLGADYKLNVQNFTELKVTDNINVNYHCSIDSAGWAYFSCSPELSSKLMFTNDKACLHIQVASDGEILEGLPTLHVYSNTLTKAVNDSDSTLRVCGKLMVPSFKAQVVGNGTLVVDNIEASYVEAAITTGKGHIVFSNGTAAKAKLSNVGTGPLEAGKLDAKDVKVTLFGTGDVDCSATEKITIYGAGSGKIYYKGNPAKVVNRSLGIKAIAIDKTE